LLNSSLVNDRKNVKVPRFNNDNYALKMSENSGEDNFHSDQSIQGYYDTSYMKNSFAKETFDEEEEP